MHKLQNANPVRFQIIFSLNYSLLKICTNLGEMWFEMSFKILESISIPFLLAPTKMNISDSQTLRLHKVLNKGLPAVKKKFKSIDLRLLNKPFFTWFAKKIFNYLHNQSNWLSYQTLLRQGVECVWLLQLARTDALVLFSRCIQVWWKVAPIKSLFLGNARSRKPLKCELHSRRNRS